MKDFQIIQKCLEGPCEQQGCWARVSVSYRREINPFGPNLEAPTEFKCDCLKAGCKFREVDCFMHQLQIGEKGGWEPA